MRARDLDVPAGTGAEYGLARGVVGIGPGRGERADRMLHRFAEVPSAVAYTFARGGRNFQRTHDDDEAEMWRRVRASASG